MTVSSYLLKQSLAASRRKQQGRFLIVFGCSFEVAGALSMGFTQCRLEISGLEELQYCKL